MEKFDGSRIFYNNTRPSPTVGGANNNNSPMDESESDLFIDDLRSGDVSNAFQSRLISSIPLIENVYGEGERGGGEEKYNGLSSTKPSTLQPKNYISPQTINSLLENLKGLLDSMDIPPIPVFIPPYSNNKDIKSEIERIFPYHTKEKK